MRDLCFCHFACIYHLSTRVTCVVSIQAHSYLMYGAMDGNRLCAVALGNKHAFGLDGVPLDYDQGYGTLRLCVTSSSLTESLSGGASIYLSLIHI